MAAYPFHLELFPQGIIWCQRYIKPKFVLQIKKYIKKNKYEVFLIHIQYTLNYLYITEWVVVGIA